ncbi:hypothetical protein GUJ93_ZPchr0013g37711 [Zizania palustris]|uniref:Uncharacterized protein n=1 Tax=Zizania palustris TaxID=103762 RepID=A0A8J5X2J5_ZIZPA|nr:hypothetical protein GUJ93_ZPchr0013g37711 [Zizania palustris]
MSSMVEGARGACPRTKVVGGGGVHGTRLTSARNFCAMNLFARYTVSTLALCGPPPLKAIHYRLFSRSPPSSGGVDGSVGGTRGVAVKQVMWGNLADMLEELRARVRDEAFVGINLEMSGVMNTLWRNTFELDHADIRYLKLRDSTC